MLKVIKVANKILWVTLVLLTLAACSQESSSPQNDSRVVALAAGGRVKTLDPALADDLASRNMVAAFYDTLLEYDYMARPYKLIPAMLKEMPQVDNNGMEYTFELRDDIYFIDAPCFLNNRGRKITSDDVIYSLKRLADANLHSPCYWMIRGKIAGLNEFYSSSLDTPNYYDNPVSGLIKIDDKRFKIVLTRPDFRFLSILALPNLAIVPREAVEFYGEKFSIQPVGSGPFFLYEWIRDCRLQLQRNPNFRESYFAEAQSASDRNRKLPLSDRIYCYQVRQPFTAWLLFLQGEIDVSVLDKDNLDLIVGGATLSPALKERGIQLLQSPEFEIRYIGFNFRDPLLQNLKLRQAISLAFSVKNRILHANNLLQRVEGPIPAGVAGYDSKLVNPYLSNDIKLAKQLLAQAGYPNGIDPKTGQPLVLSFDQGNNSAAQRQIGELMAKDLSAIGIQMASILNSAPRFVDRLRQGQTQLFRYSWVGDYPDAENFLQLFYSKNIGGCNRTGFSDPEYDRLYEKVITLSECEEQRQIYQQMAKIVVDNCAWIFEGIPISYQLKYDWLENYWPHDFGFARWKYISVDSEKRETTRKNFKPINFSF